MFSPNAMLMSVEVLSNNTQMRQAGAEGEDEIISKTISEYSP